MAGREPTRAQPRKRMEAGREEIRNLTDQQPDTMHEQAKATANRLAKEYDEHYEDIYQWLDRNAPGDRELTLGQTADLINGRPRTHRTQQRATLTIHDSNPQHEVRTPKTGAPLFRLEWKLDTDYPHIRIAMDSQAKPMPLEEKAAKRRLHRMHRKAMDAYERHREDPTCSVPYDITRDACGWEDEP